MKNKFILIAGLLAGMTAAIHAAEPHVTFDFGYTSEYVFRGIKKAGDSATNGVQVDYKSFYGGAYGVESFHDDGLRTEADFYAGYKKAINETLSYDAGLVTYWFPRKDAGGTKYSVEAYGGLTQKFNRAWAASLYTYYDFNRQAITLEGSTGYSIPLSTILALQLSAFIGTVDSKDFYPEFPGAHIRDTYSYYGFTAEVPVKLSEKATLNFGVKYGDNLNLRAGSAVSDNLYGFGRVTFGF